MSKTQLNTTQEIKFTQKIKVSDSASEQIRSKGEVLLRLSVLPGGCSGFQYQFSIVQLKDLNNLSKKDEWDEWDDFLVKDSKGNSVILIDNKSLQYVADSVVDYLSDIQKTGFVVNNPSTKSGCGCGNSFSL